MAQKCQKNGPKALQDAVDGGTPGRVVLFWIKHEPRVTTMRPLAERLVAEGHDVIVAYAQGMRTTPAAMKFGDQVRCFEVKATDLGLLRGIALVITSEKDTLDAPKTARRLAIRHSLPDYQLTKNYATEFATMPIVAANVDYLAIAVRQTHAQWSVAHYAPFLDRYLPAPLLRNRRDRVAIVPFGYPKVDRLMALGTSDAVPDTITYAPTRSTQKTGTVLQLGPRILKMLLENFPEYRIAFRPYPGPDVERTREVWEPFLGHSRFILDDSLTGEGVVRRTVAMVTDQSSVAVSFGLGLARPVICINRRHRKGLEEHETIPFEPIGMHVGSVPTLEKTLRGVLDTLQDTAAAIEARRGDFIYNPGRSIGYLAEIVPDILAGRTRPEWLEVPRRPFRAITPRAYRAQLERIVDNVAARHPPGVAPAEKALGPGFVHPVERRMKSTTGWASRNARGLRGYLSRLGGRS